MNVSQWPLVSLLAATLTATLVAKSPISAFPKSTFPGGVVLFKYEAVAQEKVSLKVNQKEVVWDLCPLPKRRSFCTFVGVEMDDTPAELSAQVFSEAGVEIHAIKVPVLPKKFPKSELKVAPRHAELSPEDQARMDQERAALKEMYEKGLVERQWEKDFLLPGKGAVTSFYGNQRTFNGTVASTHYGIDLRGNERTWVLASNAGRVIYTGNLFNAGNYVVLDHGVGLFTTYSHLSSFAVKTGDTVKPGQRLGKVGSTGRVTGPHLHWGVRIHGLYVDPQEFLRVAKAIWRR